MARERDQGKAALWNTDQVDRNRLFKVHEMHISHVACEKYNFFLITEMQFL